MPLWSIYHPVGTFPDTESKQALSKDITTIYTSVGLPAFYVIVNFIELPGTSTYIGGRPNTGDKPFIRFSADHIAVHQPNEDAAYRRVMDKVEQVLKPHVADKGYDWEFHADETERRLWRVQGIDPPPFKSEEEKLWVRENRAVPWKSGDGEQAS